MTEYCQHRFVYVNRQTWASWHCGDCDQAFVPHIPQALIGTVACVCDAWDGPSGMTHNPVCAANATLEAMKRARAKEAT